MLRYKSECRVQSQELRLALGAGQALETRFDFDTTQTIIMIPEAAMLPDNIILLSLDPLHIRYTV